MHAESESCTVVSKNIRLIKLKWSSELTHSHTHVSLCKSDGMYAGDSRKVYWNEPGVVCSCSEQGYVYKALGSFL